MRCHHQLFAVGVMALTAHAIATVRSTRVSVVRQQRLPSILAPRRGPDCRTRVVARANSGGTDGAEEATEEEDAAALPPAQSLIDGAMDARACLVQALRAGETRMTMEVDVPMLDRRLPEMYDPRAVASFTLHVAQCLASSLESAKRSIKVIFRDDDSAAAAEAQWDLAFRVTQGKYQQQLDVVSLGVDDSHEDGATVVSAVRERAEALASDGDAFLVVCPSLTSEMLATRTVLAAAGDRPVLVLNARFDLQPVELYRSECVFAIKPFRLQATPQTSGGPAPRVNRNAGGDSEREAPSGFNRQHLSEERRREFEERYGVSLDDDEPSREPDGQEEQEEANTEVEEEERRPSVVLMKRFGSPWQVFVDVDDGNGYSFVGSHHTRPEPAQLIAQAAAFLETVKQRSRARTRKGEQAPTEPTPTSSEHDDAVAYLNRVFAVSGAEAGPVASTEKTEELANAPYRLLDRIILDDLESMLVQPPAGNSPSDQPALPLSEEVDIPASTSSEKPASMPRETESSPAGVNSTSTPERGDSRPSASDMSALDQLFDSSPDEQAS